MKNLTTTTLKILLFVPLIGFIALMVLFETISRDCKYFYFIPIMQVYHTILLVIIFHLIIFS